MKNKYIIKPCRPPNLDNLTKSESDSLNQISCGFFSASPSNIPFKYGILDGGGAVTTALF